MTSTWPARRSYTSPSVFEKETPTRRVYRRVLAQKKGVDPSQDISGNDVISSVHSNKADTCFVHLQVYVDVTCRLYMLTRLSSYSINMYCIDVTGAQLHNKRVIEIKLLTWIWTAKTQYQYLPISITLVQLKVANRPAPIKLCWHGLWHRLVAASARSKERFVWAPPSGSPAGFQSYSSWYQINTCTKVTVKSPA